MRSFLIGSLLVVAAGCADPVPTPSVDAGTGGDAASADMSATSDLGAMNDASASDAGDDLGVTFTDGGSDDADVDGGLLHCVDYCGDGACETRVRLRAQCLPGEAEMSECTHYVADFSCHDAGF